MVLSGDSFHLGDMYLGHFLIVTIGCEVPSNGVEARDAVPRMTSHNKELFGPEWLPSSGARCLPESHTAQALKYHNPTFSI